jgi:TRAP-type C4-dicarboxylate transport system substrate-binding protein
MFTKRIKILFIVIVVLVLAATTYAFAAANTVPASKAGDGSGTISGYAVSAIHYALNGTNPTTIDTVTFTLDTAPATGGTIKIRLVSSGSTWYSCTNVTTAVTCTTTGAPVSTADTLQVVVAQ